MNSTETALLGYIAWFILLIIAIEVYRTIMVVKQGKAANSFQPDGADVSPLMHRLCRAHANCYESFPFIGGILLFAIATSTENVTSGLALYLLGARVAQSVSHMMSSSATLAQIRFVFFLVQVGIVCYWLWRYANSLVLG